MHLWSMAHHKLLTLSAAGVVVVGVVVAVVIRDGEQGRPQSASNGTGDAGISSPMPVGTSAGPINWPDSSNTGVPASAKPLKEVGDLVVTKNGARYSRLDIDGCVDVKADNVTISQSLIRCSRNGEAVRVFDGAKALVLDQVEIDGLGKSPSCLGFDNFTITRSNLHDCADGIDFGSNVVIEDCYIHDLARGDETHNDALQTLGGNDDLIKGNTLDVYRASTDDLMNSAIQTGHLQTPLSNVVVEHNYMDGGNYTVNAGSTSTNGYTIDGYVFKDNVFGRHFRYGPVQAIGPGTIFDASNVWADDGRPVDPAG